MNSIQIRSTLPERRRAGIAFSSVAITIAVAALSDEQIASIKADPFLIVHEVDVAPTTALNPIPNAPAPEADVAKPTAKKSAKR